MSFKYNRNRDNETRAGRTGEVVAQFAHIKYFMYANLNWQRCRICTPNNVKVKDTTTTWSYIHDVNATLDLSPKSRRTDLKLN